MDCCAKVVNVHDVVQNLIVGKTEVGEARLGETGTCPHLTLSFAGPIPGASWKSVNHTKVHTSTVMPVHPMYVPNGWDNYYLFSADFPGLL